MLQTLLASAVVVSTLITLILLALPSQYIPSAAGKNFSASNGNEPVSIQVLVLGDIGRSPRMQYHALSIAKHGGYVELVGYRETDLHPELLNHSNIAVVSLHCPPESWQTNNRILFLFVAPLKVLFQIWSLVLVLGYHTKPAKWMLVQNPPSIPTLLLAQLMCFLRNARLIIDWHNFGFSILALKLGPDHLLVRISKWYEINFARGANVNLTVTNAMARVLKDQFSIKAAIFPLHDRPPSHFQPFSRNQRSAFLSALPETAPRADSIRQGFTRLLVSPTSWTADEDFDLLLNALCKYSMMATSSHPQLPELLMIITGKGPLKESFMQKVRDFEDQGRLEMVTLTTLWLSAHDYASLLASADVGISLHTSSSGVDLPMKILDMFGAGLAVVGWNQYEAWPELVTEGFNGKGFGDVDGLADALVELFGDDGRELENLGDGAKKEGRRRWDEEWEPVLGKLLELT